MPRFSSAIRAQTAGQLQSPGQPLGRGPRLGARGNRVLDLVSIDLALELGRDRKRGGGWEGIGTHRVGSFDHQIVFRSGEAKPSPRLNARRGSEKTNGRAIARLLRSRPDIQGDTGNGRRVRRRPRGINPVQCTELGALMPIAPVFSTGAVPANGPITPGQHRPTHRPGSRSEGPDAPSVCVGKISCRQTRPSLRRFQRRIGEVPRY